MTARLNWKGRDPDSVSINLPPPFFSSFSFIHLLLSSSVVPFPTSVPLLSIFFVPSHAHIVIACLYSTFNHNTSSPSESHREQLTFSPEWHRSIATGVRFCNTFSKMQPFVQCTSQRSNGNQCRELSHLQLWHRPVFPTINYQILSQVVFRPC